jgi:L-lactate dehydrogenase complex protein LldF
MATRAPVTTESQANEAHPQGAARFLARAERARFHDGALWQIRKRRDASANSVPEWEELRTLAQQIKAHTVARLADYLELFEKNAESLGARVHFAQDAEEHNRIVLSLLKERGITRVVKSKSMLTEECGLNPWLETHGIEVTDTDLGELIVQLRHEPPSHIVLPAIHLKREDVAETFQEKLAADGTTDPKALTEVARGYLRQKFLNAQAGITGVNFAVAETGGIVVCTNEGNADLGTALPPLHIACMGIEKLVPRAADLGVFARLLARSATGQAITAYTSHYHGPRPGAELHIVLVDNGRTRVRQETRHLRALSCIRCGACMNTCPVFRRSGGHSYHSHLPGPIGSILGPLTRPGQHKSLPYASSLCGSCSAVCPVKINLHEQLLELRERQVDGPATSSGKAGIAHGAGNMKSSARGAAFKGIAARAAAWVLAKPAIVSLLGSIGRWLLRRYPGLHDKGPLAAWHSSRALPELPEKSFRSMMRERHAARKHGVS